MAQTVKVVHTGHTLTGLFARAETVEVVQGTDR